MRTFALIFLLLAILGASGCTSGKSSTQGTAVENPEPREGDHPGTGKVTKINMQLGSVEIDHNEMPGLMPAHKMEFYVADKALLDGISVGDDVEFVILYKKSTYTVTKIARKN